MALTNPLTGIMVYHLRKGKDKRNGKSLFRFQVANIDAFIRELVAVSFDRLNYFL
jgi:hypothetical protein